MAVSEVHHLFHSSIADHSFSADNNLLAVARENEVDLFQRSGSNYSLKDVLKGHDKTITSVDIAPNSGKIVTCSQGAPAFHLPSPLPTPLPTSRQVRPAKLINTYSQTAMPMSGSTPLAVGSPLSCFSASIAQQPTSAGPLPRRSSPSAQAHVSSPSATSKRRMTGGSQSTSRNPSAAPSLPSHGTLTMSFSLLARRIPTAVSSPPTSRALISVLPHRRGVRDCPLIPSVESS